MTLKVGVIRSEGTPSYGVDLNAITPRDWGRCFEEACFESWFISPDEFEHLGEIMSYDVIANPYGGVIPEYKEHLVTSGLKTFIIDGGIFLEVMPPPFYLCHFKEDGTLTSMTDIIAEQYNQILTKSSGFDRQLELTEIGKKILGPLKIPNSVFSANKGTTISTLYNYSSKPGLTLITTEQEEPILDVLTIGDGRIVRWGCNLEAPFQEFLFKSFTRIVNYLFKDANYQGTQRRAHKEVTLSISPVNYWVGSPSKQRMSVTVLCEDGKSVRDLIVRLKPATKHMPEKNVKAVPAEETCIIFDTSFDPKSPGEWSVEVLTNGRILGRKDFEPSFTARDTVLKENELKNARPKTRRHEGFDDFWNETLKEAAETEEDAEEILDNERSNSKMQLYRIYLKSLEGDRIHGWFCRPIKGIKTPAILILPGYSDGSKFIPYDLIEMGCSIFALDPRGHGESVNKVERTFPGFITKNVLNRFEYPYRGVYIDCLKAIKYLLSNPHVDEKRVGVMGMSQGGGLALLTAALEEKLAFAIADSPFLTDMNHGIELATEGPYTELADYISENPLQADIILENLGFFDVTNFVKKVKCPTLMCVGLIDTICPPITAYSTFNMLKCAKRLDIYPRMGHFCGVYGHQERKLEWIRRYLKI